MTKTAWHDLPNAPHIDRILADLQCNSLAWDAAGYAAGSAISALIAWDDSAKFLDMTPDQLRFWIALSDDPKATLLLPAVVALA